MGRHCPEICAILLAALRPGRTGAGSGKGACQILKHNKK
jgi:hypothetical protein